MLSDHVPQEGKRRPDKEEKARNARNEPPGTTIGLKPGPAQGDNSTAEGAHRNRGAFAVEHKHYGDQGGADNEDGAEVVEPSDESLVPGSV